MLTLFCISDIRSSIWFSLGLSTTLGSKSPVGLIICSTILPFECSFSYSAGVALTNIHWFIFFSNSSNLSGLLSNADGNLKP